MGRCTVLKKGRFYLRLITILLIFSLLFAFFGCNADTGLSVRDHDSTMAGVIGQPKYENSGSFRSHLGTGFDIIVNWTASNVRQISDEKYIVGLEVDVILECASIVLAEQDNGNVLNIAGKRYSFKTDRIESAAHDTVRYRLFKKNVDFDISAGESVSVPMSVEWTCNAEVNGIKIEQNVKISDTAEVSAEDFELPFTESDSGSDTPKESVGGDKKRIAITFDDGPHSKYTKLIVDKACVEYGGRVTFFVVGERIPWDNGASMIYAAEHGCEIGIHGYTHTKDYAVCTDKHYREEIYGTLDAIHAYLPNYEVKLMRPTGGSISSERAAESEFSVILWSIDSEDWKNKGEKGTEVIVENVLSSVSDGDIILMHDLYENTYEAFCIIIERLHGMGYEFVTVSELLGDSMQAGVVYSCG